MGWVVRWRPLILNLCRTDADDHQRNIDVGAEKAGPGTLTMCHAVDVEEYYAAGESVLIQEFAYRVLIHLPGGALLAADVDGEFGGIPIVVVEVAMQDRSPASPASSSTGRGWSSRSCGGRERIFGSTSTSAIAPTGSSDRLSYALLRSLWLGLNLAIPYSITLVAIRRVPSNSSIESAISRPEAASSKHVAARRSIPSTSSPAGS